MKAQIYTKYFVRIPGLGHVAVAWLGGETPLGKGKPKAGRGHGKGDERGRAMAICSNLLLQPFGASLDSFIIMRIRTNSRHRQLYTTWAALPAQPSLRHHRLGLASAPTAYRLPPSQLSSSVLSTLPGPRVPLSLLPTITDVPISWCPFLAPSKTTRYSYLYPCY